jgi:hypothetical protein
MQEKICVKPAMYYSGDDDDSTEIKIFRSMESWGIV